MTDFPFVLFEAFVIHWPIPMAFFGLLLGLLFGVIPTFYSGNSLDSETFTKTCTLPFACLGTVTGMVLGLSIAQPVWWAYSFPAGVGTTGAIVSFLNLWVQLRRLPDCDATEPDGGGHAW